MKPDAFHDTDPAATDALPVSVELQRAVRSYARDHGWLTHRRMIDQHLRTCLRDPKGFGAAVLRHYRHRRCRRGAVLKRLMLVAASVSVATGVHHWFFSP